VRAADCGLLIFLHTANVRARIVESSLALSCCGIITAARFFDPGENRNRPAAEFFSNGKIFPESGKRISIEQAQFHANNWFYSMTWVG
jgi:hypothetical protein